MKSDWSHATICITISVCHTTAVYTPELDSILRLLMATYHFWLQILNGWWLVDTRLSWFLHRQHFLQKVMRQKCLSSPIQCVAGRLSDVADILQKYRLCIPNDASLVQLGAQVGNSPKILSTSPRPSGKNRDDIFLENVLKDGIRLVLSQTFDLREFCT